MKNQRQCCVFISIFSWSIQLVINNRLKTRASHSTLGALLYFNKTVFVYSLWKKKEATLFS